MSRVLVSGAGGFLGSHVMTALRGAGYQGVSLTRGGEHPFDVTDAAGVESLVARESPTHFVHLAGTARGTDEHIHRVNFLGTQFLLEALARHAPSCRLILIGSAAEYGRSPDAVAPLGETAACVPVNGYGRAKLAATNLAAEFARTAKLPAVTVLRLFNVVGPGVPAHLLVGALLRRIDAALKPGAAREVVVGNVDVERDYVAVEDTAQAIVTLLSKRADGELFNLCSGRAVTIRQLIESLLALAPERIGWRQDPALLRPDDIPRSVGDWRKAAAAFGFAPRISLEQSLQSAWSAFFARNQAT